MRRWRRRAVDGVGIWLFCWLHLPRLCIVLVHDKEEGDACSIAGIGFSPTRKLVGAVNSGIQLLVGLAQAGRHAQWVVQVGQAAVWIQGTGIEHGLGGRFDGSVCLALRSRGERLGEVVVDDMCRVKKVTFQTSTHTDNPSHVHGRVQYTEMKNLGIGNKSHPVTAQGIRAEKSKENVLSSFR